jgi:hypothetical protein
MITNLEIGYTGRLGNQLFQYAACYATAKRLNTNFVIPKSNVDKIKQDGCFNFSNNQWIPYSFRMYDVFKITAPQVIDLPSFNTYKESNFHYSEAFQNIIDNTSIEGYFQSEKYFIDYKDEILKEFSFKDEIYTQSLKIISSIKDKETVAVHIRRGDNVINPTFPLISMEYIQQALNHFSDKEYNYLIISDDINFCKEVFPQDVLFSDGKNDLVDLCLMSLADHNIISNSSFSWWGAYLNSNPNKKVIAPSNWFKDKNINLQDLFPKNWIVL